MNPVNLYKIASFYRLKRISQHFACQNQNCKMNTINRSYRDTIYTFTAIKMQDGICAFCKNKNSSALDLAKLIEKEFWSSNDSFETREAKAFKKKLVAS